MSTSPDKPAAPVLSWAILQLIALMLLAGHMPLWARAEASFIEKNSLQTMLAIQFAASALLFPWLMRDLRTSLFFILLADLFLQLAGLLGGQGWGTVFVAMLESSAWLTGLAIWAVSLKSLRVQLTVISLATAVVIGGWMLKYLSLEFGVGAPLSVGVSTFRIVLIANIFAALLTALLPRRQIK